MHDVRGKHFVEVESVRRECRIGILKKNAASSIEEQYNIKNLHVPG